MRLNKYKQQNLIKRGIEIMKFNKKLLLTIPVVTLALSPIAIRAFDKEANAKPEIVSNKIEEKAGLETATGKVIELIAREDKNFIRVDLGEEHIIDFYPIENAIFADINGLIKANDIKAGDEVKIFYELPLFMTAIHPAQMPASVIVNTKGVLAVHFDAFDKDLISSDNYLKLNISNETIIIDTNGNTVSADKIANKKLIVFYSVSTRSIPAQTTPEKIIVVGEGDESSVKQSEYQIAVPPIYQFTDEEIKAMNESMNERLQTSKIVVNDVTIEAPKAFVNENGTVMLPVRSIAEALGFIVSWNQETRTVTFNGTKSLTIDSNEYINRAGEKITLTDVSVIKGGISYAPEWFFIDILEAEVMIMDNEVHVVTTTE